MTNNNNNNNLEKRILVNLCLAGAALIGTLGITSYYMEQQNRPRIEIYENGKIVRTIYDPKEIKAYEEEHFKRNAESF